MTVGLLQLIARSYQDNILTKNPSVTFFKYSYKTQPLFYKEERQKKNIKLNWNNNFKFKFDKDIHLLGNVFLKVKIPFFKFSKVTTKTERNVVKNNIINKLIFDSYDTYLFIVDDKYYIIPYFLLSNNLNNFTLNKMDLDEIKEYLHDDLLVLLNQDSIIYLLDFPENTIINDVIPILLKFSSGIDEYYINLLLENSNSQLNKNLLTQKSYNKHITKKLNDFLFNNFQNNFSFDKNKDIYNLFANEINYFFNEYNKTLNFLESNTDLNKSLIFYRSKSLETDEVTFLKNTIYQNPYLLEYILLNIHSKINNNFTFYKTISINFLQDQPYELDFTDDYIIPIDSNGNIITSNIPDNKLYFYYPSYRIDLNKLNLNISNDLIIKTLDNNDVILLDENSTLTFVLNTVRPSETTTKITLKITNPLRTKNDINIITNIDDTNLNNEWNINITKNLEKLDNANELESYLFNIIKSRYYSIENIITNLFNNIFENFSKEEVIDIWISLETLRNKFRITDISIHYENIISYYEQKKDIKNDYPSYYNIYVKKQDLFNSYLILLIEFIFNIKTKYFIDDTFINIFFYTIFDYFYKRFVNISNLQNTNTQY